MSATAETLFQHWGHKYFRDRDEVYSDIFENRQFNAIYLTMLLMAGLIALLGLLINSPAVIIGAMLISPLMGPILSCGLALTLADWDLGKKGLRNVALSVVEVLAITALVTALSPLKDSTAEILARSNPNLMDLLIAFFSGVAGSIALTSRSKTGLTIIPGVAIATAVMPPLATTGFGIATAQWQIARGSFMLFFTNLVAIIISADLVFFVAGFRTSQRSGSTSPAFLRSRAIIALVILAVISIPLIRTLAQAAQQARARRSILTVLRTLEKPHEVQLGTWHFDLSADHAVVDASVTTPERLDDKVIEQTRKLLSAELNRPAELHLRQIPVDDGRSKPARDFLSGGNLASVPAPPKPPEEAISGYQDRIQKALRQLAEPAGFSDVRVMMVGVGSDGLVMAQVEGRRNIPADAATLSVLASALERELAHPVTLQCALGIGPEDLAFRPGSSQLSAPSVDRLRGIVGSAETVKFDQAFLSLPADSPLNLRRVRTVEQLLKLPVVVSVDSSNTTEKDKFSLVMRQIISSTRKD